MTDLLPSTQPPARPTTPRQVADGYGTIEEVELVRVLAHTLDCPLPPLVVGVIR